MHRPERQSHRLTVLSPEPVHTLLVYGCQATLLTESTWPRKVWRTRAVVASHSRAVWSMDPETRKSPVWWKAQDHTACVWSARVALQAAWAKPHSLTVLSPEAVASIVPLGWKSTADSQLPWPSPDMTRSQLGTLHTFQVSSSETVARMGLRGCRASPAQEFRWPRKVFFRAKRSAGAGSYAASRCGFRGAPSPVSGGSDAPAFLRRGFVGIPPAVAGFPSACSSSSCFSRASTFALMRSRSSRMSIFSFIAVSYLFCSSFRVGSKLW
mmetsp:Transcript_3936/g.6336  ORF Transcript_3936/g.6336 Transcript_3936/m.6336 type:complete len:268 (+) Transcript_3936:389-1192(+)